MAITQEAPPLGLLDGIPTHEILEGLARLHQLVLVADGHARSQGRRETCQQALPEVQPGEVGHAAVVEIGRDGAIAEESGLLGVGSVGLA